MGFWSKLKNAIKKVAKAVVRAVKAIVRTVIKIVATIVSFVIGFVGELFLFWKEKKLRINVCILHPAGQKELISIADADLSVQRAAQIIKDKFNTKVIHYGKPYIQVIKEDEYIVDGSIKITDVNELIGVRLESEEFDSIGGYIIGHLRRLPEENEVIEVDNIKFCIESLDKNRIKKVRIFT